VAIKKLFFIALGFSSLALGVVGTILPMVPTTPFVLLAAICFGKSSDRLHTWFLSTQLYRKNVEPFVQRRGMAIKVKLILLSAVTFFMGISFIMMTLLSAPISARIALASIWLCHVLYFGFLVKTVQTCDVQKDMGCSSLQGEGAAPKN